MRPSHPLTFPILAALAALAAAGCSGPKGGTDVGNGASVTLDLRAYDEPPASGPASLTLGDGARLDAVWMAIDRVRLRPGSACSGGDGEVDLEGPLVADLIGGGVLGGPASFAIAPGPFCELRLGFHKIDGAPPEGAPAELSGLSLVVRGARADGVPFVVRSEKNNQFELKAKGGSFSLPSGRSPLFLAYGVRAWMAALDLGSLAGSSLVVSEQENKDRLDAFELAVEQSARLFRDEDDDGALSPFESAAEDTLAE